MLSGLYLLSAGSAVWGPLVVLSVVRRRMLVAHMIPQSPSVPIGVPAFGAHKLLDVGVRVGVLLEVGGALEALVAVAAHVLVDPAMCLLVLVQAVARRERFRAARALPARGRRGLGGGGGGGCGRWWRSHGELMRMRSMRVAVAAVVVGCCCCC